MDLFITEWERALSITATPKRVRRNHFPGAVKIYALTFEDNTAYIGISKNPEKRLHQHIRKSTNHHVREKIKNKKFEFSIVGEIASRNELFKEDEMMAIYKERGYLILNHRSGGGLGFLGR